MPRTKKVIDKAIKITITLYKEQLDKIMKKATKDHRGNISQSIQSIIDNY